MRREELEPVIRFKCPKCGKELEMRQTPHNNLTMITKFHTHPLSKKEIKEMSSPTKEYIRILHEEDNIENPREYLKLWKKEEEEARRNYCMCFTRSSAKRIYDLTGGLIQDHLPIVFSSLDKAIDKKETLKVALKALKQGKLGIQIWVHGTKRILGSAYIWKCRNRFYGVMDGILSSENFVATKDFNDIKEFVEKWYNWGK